MEERMTIDQVLAVTIDILESIDVPMKKLDEIGVPIKKAVGNLRLCIQAVQESRAQQQQEEAKPELSVVPCDEPDVSECEETEIRPAE